MKDLCATCKHRWTDFPMPLEEAIPHCDFVNEKYRFVSMNEIVPYPCTKYPFLIHMIRNKLLNLK